MLEVVPLISALVDIPEAQLALLHDGKILNDYQKSFKSYNIKDNDMLVINRKAPASTQRNTIQAAEPRPEDYELFRQQILANPDLIRQLEQSQPELLEAARNNSPTFPSLVQKLQRELVDSRLEKAKAYRDLELDPFNVEAQRKIEEMIQAENIATNMEHAMEYHPESFGQVHMLYIPCEINGTPLKAFVDCGAQTTIMMKRFADKCGVDRLIDTRFSGVAKGVGTGKIVGRVHSVSIKVGHQFLPCSLTILDGDGPDVLFGLDMLKRHQVRLSFA